jgi:DNA repair protein RadC
MIALRGFDMGQVNYNLNLTIKEMPESERPMERMMSCGSSVLSDAELLALIIRIGSRSESAVNLARRLLKGKDGIQGLRFLMEADIAELSEIKGIGPSKACQIKAVVELSKRFAMAGPEQRATIKSPADVAGILMEDMRYLNTEHFKVVLLNTKNSVLAVETISVGGLNSSIVHPREVFKPAIKRSCASVILAHNHPSGDPSPSNEDINVTRRLYEAGNILGIEVLDHIIIGDWKFLSFKEKRLL